MNHLQLKNLDTKVRNKTATEQEKLDYLEMLRENNSITKEQLDNYKKGNLKDDLIIAALAIGGMLLITWLLSKILKK
jgi:hypothetical protein